MWPPCLRFSVRGSSNQSTDLPAWAQPASFSFSPLPPCLPGDLQNVTSVWLNFPTCKGSYGLVCDTLGTVNDKKQSAVLLTAPWWTTRLVTPPRQSARQERRSAEGVSAGGLCTPRHSRSCWKVKILPQVLSQQEQYSGCNADILPSCSTPQGCWMLCKNL